MGRSTHRCFVLAAAVTSMVAVASCTSAPKVPIAPGATATTRPTPPASTSMPAITRPAALVAIRTDNSVVSLDPATGAVRKTLGTSSTQTNHGFGFQPLIALDRIHAMVYFDALTSPCGPGNIGAIWRVPLAGGTPVKLATGVEPTVSADGAKLAYVVNTCASNTYTPKIHVRDLHTGAETTLPDPAPGGYGIPPFPVMQMSLSTDGSRLAVAVNAVQDNEGMQLFIDDVPTGESRAVPVTQIVSGEHADTEYVLPAVFMPDGTLFAHQACCAGIDNPRKPSSTLAIIDATSGQLVRWVATGVPTRVHRSLGVDASGRWLLYVSGSDLEVSDGGAKPTVLAHGVQAAAW